MKYSVVDFLVFSLLRWAFSQNHPLKNAEYAPDRFVQLLMYVTPAKDYVEAISRHFFDLAKRVGFQQ